MALNIQRDKIIVAGDFNLPGISRYDTMLTLQCLDGSNPHCNTCFNYRLTQTVSDFTSSQGSSQSVLDLLFVGDHFSEEIDVDIADGISDHNIVVESLKLDSAPKDNGKITHIADCNRANDVAILDYFIITPLFMNFPIGQILVQLTS